jgi:hypothetical protein
MGGQLSHSSGVHHRKPVDKSEITFLIAYRYSGSQFLMLNSLVDELLTDTKYVTHSIIVYYARIGRALIAKIPRGDDDRHVPSAPFQAR